MVYFCEPVGIGVCVWVGVRGDCEDPPRNVSSSEFWRARPEINEGEEWGKIVPFT